MIGLKESRAHHAGEYCGPDGARQPPEVKLRVQSDGHEVVLVEEVESHVPNLPPRDHHVHTRIGNRFDLLEKTKTHTHTQKSDNV